MGWLIAIDPGKVTGAALFRDGLLVQTATDDGDAPGENSGELPADCEIVAERPHAGYGKASVEDLITLAIRLGRVLGSHPAKLVTPVQWKGNMTKAATQARIRKVLAPAELARVIDDHNVFDAVGIGLWRLGRF